MTTSATQPVGAPCLLAAALLVLAVGCKPTAGGVERYIPSEPTARRALDVVLAAWKAGESAEALRMDDPPVKLAVDDGTRRPGQRLVGYEILGEISAEGPRTFMVQLVLDEPPEEIDTCYYVVGIDPIWVMRKEDYETVAHWIMKMPKESADAIPREPASESVSDSE